jgi:hypothetical protein
MTFTGLSIGSVEVGVDKKATDLFEVNWESVRYNKSVSRNNLKISSDQQDSRVSENLSLLCQVEIKDPNLVLGICTEGIITEMTDNQGQKVDPGQKLPQLKHMSYEGPRYRQRYTQRPKLSRWRTVINSIFRIQQTPFRPQLYNELQPSRLNMQLDIGLLDPPEGEIKSLKGYFYAMTAESLEYVDVPFEPNNTWVRLTDDLDIQVSEAQCTVSPSRVRYNYSIEERRAGGNRRNRLTAADYLPEKIVTSRQFIGIDGKPTRSFSGLNSLPAHVTGRGSGSGNYARIEKIRFVIAVKPSHHKIPFELKKIPLPDPESREEKNKNKR